VDLLLQKAVENKKIQDKKHEEYLKQISIEERDRQLAEVEARNQRIIDTKEAIKRARDKRLAAEALRKKEQEEKDRIALELQKKVEEENLKIQNAIIDDALKLGYKAVLFDVGIINTIDYLVKRELKLKQLKKVVIEVSGSDGYFQSGTRHKGGVMFYSEYSQIPILVKGLKGTLIEGTYLSDLKVDFVTVTKLGTYRNGLNQRKQVLHVRIVDLGWH
jgi:hypothetical protein